MTDIIAQFVLTESEEERESLHLVLIIYHMLQETSVFSFSAYYHSVYETKLVIKLIKCWVKGPLRSLNLQPMSY